MSPISTRVCLATPHTPPDVQMEFFAYKQVIEIKPEYEMKG